MRNRFFAGMRLSEILREGFAEFFTRDILERYAKNFGTLQQEAYQGYFKSVQRLVATTGENLARSAYFGGGSTAIKKLKMALELNIKHFPLLVPSFMLESEYETACSEVSLMRKRR